MRKPVLLDGFCKAGGATKGYQLLGELERQACPQPPGGVHSQTKRRPPHRVNDRGRGRT